MENLISFSRYHFLQVNASLFPCEVSKESARQAEEAVEAAVKAWGAKSLAELEAEDRLSFACERVGNQKCVYSLDQIWVSEAEIRTSENFKGGFRADTSLVVAAGTNRG